MRWIAERLAEQAFGRRGVAQRRQQEVRGGTYGINGPIEATPTPLDPNIRFIDPPGLVGRLELTAQPLFQFRTVTLNPTPDRRAIRLKPALGEQLFHIAQRRRIAQVPTHGAQNQLRRRLPPLEDCRSGCLLHGFSGYQPPLLKLQHIHGKSSRRSQKLLCPILCPVCPILCPRRRSFGEIGYQCISYSRSAEILSAIWCLCP